MLDIKLIREKPEDVKENMRKRHKDEKIIDDIVKKDKDWRNLKVQIDNLRAERNNVSKEISELKKTGRNASSAMKKAKKIPEEIEILEKKAKELEEERNSSLLLIPNFLHSSVPIGKDASENKEIKKWGKIKKFSFELLNHSELVENLGYADFDAGRNNSGEGFNYLLGDIAMLDHALQRYGVDFITKKGFTLVVPPLMLNFETLLGALNGLKDFEDVVYKIEKENLYLIGTAEHALVSLFKNKTINKEKIPIKLCALTPCFRKEIGSHGVDTKGLFRMHQFNKVEQVVYSIPEKSFEILEEIQKITEEFFQSLELPYRVIEICSGDLGAKFAKQYDIEVWFPRQGKYAEVTSAGNCTDYQARALNIRYLDKGEKRYLDILNNTMVATSRAMVAILENYQQKDGSILVPKAIIPYMNGKKKIEKGK
ncbi:serine--tRNA ligase [Candidatus Pacearchaeota archaeon]|nr:serine--tRNA ligase [Candidatus Pacearchaeota archaeon]